MAPAFNELSHAAETRDKLTKLVIELDKQYLSHKLSGATFDSENLVADIFRYAMCLEVLATQIIFRGGEGYRDLLNDMLHVAAEAFEKLVRYFPIGLIERHDGQVHPAVHAALCYAACLNHQNAITVINRLYTNVNFNDFQTPGMSRIDTLFQWMLFNLLGRKMLLADRVAANVIAETTADINSDRDKIKKLALAVKVLTEYMLNGGDIKKVYHDYFSALKDIGSDINDALYIFIIQVLNAIGLQMLEFSTRRNLQLDERFVQYLINDRGIFELWQSQLEAIKAGCLTESNVVVSLPTSSGKTLLAELRTIAFLSGYDKKVIYLVPTKALGQQILRSIRPGVESIGKNAGLVMNISDQIDSDTYENSNFVVITPEKLELMIRNRPEILDEVGLVVVDEFHSIGQDDRGLKLDFLLYRLKKLDGVLFFILSAVVDNVEEVAEWIHGLPVKLNWQPTKVTHGYYIRQGNQVTISKVGSLEIPIIPDINETVSLAAAFNEIGAVLIIDMTKDGVENKAREFLDYKKDARQPTNEQVELSNQLELLYSETHPLVEMTRHGIAYHHADMENEARSLIERALKQKQIDVLFATTTLAEGVDFPVTSVIISSLFQSGKPISMRLLNNISGRAGRAGYVNEGYAIIVCPQKWSKKDALELWRKPNEPLYSVLSDVARVLYHPEKYLYRRKRKSDGTWEIVLDEAKSGWLERILSTLESYIWALANEGIITIDDNSIDELIGELFLFPTTAEEEEKGALHGWIVQRRDELQQIKIPENVQKVLVCTGFSFVSCQRIFDEVEEYIGKAGTVYLNEDFVEWFVELAMKVKEVKPKKKYKKLQHFAILKTWVFGDGADIQVYFGAKEKLKMAEYVATQIRLLFSWLAYAVAKVIEESYGESLGFHIQYLPDFIAYGTSNPIVVNLRDLGFDKVTAAKIAEYYPNEVTGNKAQDAALLSIWLNLFDLDELLRNMDSQNLVVRKRLLKNIVNFEKLELNL